MYINDKNFDQVNGRVLMSLLASAKAKNDKEKVMELKNQLQKERVQTLDNVVALGRLKVKIYGDIVPVFLTQYSMITNMTSNSLLGNDVMRLLQGGCIERSRHIWERAARDAVQNNMECMAGWGIYGSAKKGSSELEIPVKWLLDEDADCTSRQMPKYKINPMLAMLASTMAEDIAYANEMNKYLEFYKSRVDSRKKELSFINECVGQITILLTKIEGILNMGNRGIEDTLKTHTEWNRFTDSEKKNLYRTVKALDSLQRISETPVLENGFEITPQIKAVMGNGRTLL